MGPLLGTLKLILLLPILVLWFALTWILVELVGAPFRVVRVVDAVLGRVALVLMGFWWTTMKRMIIRPAIAALARPESFSLHSEKSGQPSDAVQPGDWIIANLTSYCDLIWYWCRYSGVVMVVNDFEGGGIVPCPNRFLAIYHYFIRNTNSKTGGCIVPAVVGYPMIIFPEGVSSNGRGVLKFVANLSGAKRNQRIHLTCTKFTSNLFNPAFPGPFNFTSFFSHLWQLCNQLQNTLTCRTILPATLFASNFDLPSATEPQYNRTLQQIIAALGHLRPLNLDARDKISFLKSL